MLASVRRQLAAKGANQDVQAYVEDLLLERHQSQAQALSAEVQKRRALVEHCNKLEVSMLAFLICPIASGEATQVSCQPLACLLLDQA